MVWVKWVICVIWLRMVHLGLSGGQVRVTTKVSVWSKWLGLDRVIVK